MYLMICWIYITLKAEDNCMFGFWNIELKFKHNYKNLAVQGVEWFLYSTAYFGEVLILMLSRKEMSSEYG